MLKGLRALFAFLDMVEKGSVGVSGSPVSEGAQIPSQRGYCTSAAPTKGELRASEEGPASERLY
jgi:hypothetical protein